jgi:hypothetical protein
LHPRNIPPGREWVQDGFPAADADLIRGTESHDLHQISAASPHRLHVVAFISERDGSPLGGLRKEMVMF